MRCKVCSAYSQVFSEEKIMGKYNIKYFHCAHCDFVQTEEPYWLAEAYARPINISDTGYMARNLFFKKRLTILLYLLFGKDGLYLDYAGGYGVFVRLMRDIGFNFYWDDKYTKNLFACGFEWEKSDKVNAVTLFEAFEHFVEPMIEIEKLLSISETIIFSTDLHPNPIPQPKEWWYYGLDHGQHIAFYSTTTFEYIAKQLKLNYYNLGSLHVLSANKIAPWKLIASRFSKFGLDKLIGRLFTSKTWSDYERTSRM